MECLGPECAGMILDWLRAQARVQPKTASSPSEARQGLLWKSDQYQDEAPAILSIRELAGAIEHLQYAVFRRYNNQLTRRAIATRQHDRQRTFQGRSLFSARTA